MEQFFVECIILLLIHFLIIYHYVTFSIDSFCIDDRKVTICNCFNELLKIMFYMTSQIKNLIFDREPQK